MEAIRQAICRLESIPATLRKGRGVEDAIIQLSSTVKLLELPVASANTFTRLAENLRGRLQPLYRISLPLTLNFAVAVLQFIHCSKLVSTISGRNSPNPWENLLISLFSGLLVGFYLCIIFRTLPHSKDLMDESSNKKYCENIAYALYPAICPLYFVSQSGSSLSFHGELLSMAYQTLTATVSSHPRNTATLREHYIDRKTLGVTILRTKDFLALESLLDLFGSLIPSSKGGKAKRSKFVEDVFDTSIFKNAGTRIHKLLEDISCSDWSVSSERIISVLAESDVSFPQPFEASALMLNDSSMNSFSPFYIDQNQFVINIDKDGSIETLAVPYSITKNIVVSTSTTAELVEVVVQLTQSPTLGNQPLFLPSSEGPTISWDVKKLSLINFDKALKSRHLNIEKSNSTKLSKVKPIELGFHSNYQDSLILSKKRLEQLSQSWAFPVSSQDARGVEIIETSPLMPQTAEVITSEQRALVSRTTEPPTSAALNPNGGNLPHSRMDFPRIPITSYPTTPRPHYEDTLQWISDDEDADVQFLPQKYKKRQLIESDNDTSEVDEDKSKKIITPNITPEFLSKQQSFSSVTIPAKILSEKVSIKTTKSLTSDVNVTSDSINMDVTEDSPQRSKHELQEASSPLSARPYKRAKYGRKECKISPSSLSSSRIDFEEIPKLNNKMKVELKSPMKPKASRMNQKVKPQIKPRAASAKKRAVKIQQVNSNKETVPAKKSAQQEGDDLAIASLPIEDEENRHGMASRRSVRASTLRARGKGPQAMNDTLTKF
ncbi:hypothetical protein BDN70DRAFT_265506 [Pholiota conissans]|uniref:Uncharacterized protein n=1 Tax=Pholiota conissans TaxID=109636 RepID=A0A9P5Z9X8_9AGAR|nr:hypothetical protein BDN70DRAFT_265506 [Pholiota conissans]